MSKIALVFPGQGSQILGMGKSFYEHNNQAKAIYDLADKLFAEYHQTQVLSISEVSFKGPEEELNKTFYTQPALLLASIVAFEASRQSFALSDAAFVAGHSLGEFSALYAAGVLSLEDAIKLTIKRADLMSQAQAGAMAAIIGMDEIRLQSMVADHAGTAIANYNSPDQIVITGTQEGVKALSQTIENFANTETAKIRVIPLNVSGAFHSPLMKQASIEFAEAIDSVEFHDARIPIIQNYTAQATTNKDQIKTNLKQQMTGSVRWTQTVALLFQEGITHIYELGSGKVLAGLIKKQDRRFPITNIASVEDLQVASLSSC